MLGGLTTLRPRLMSSLLKNCTSVKAKRLFLYMANQEKLAWVRKLDLEGVDLGTGKRQIVAGGELDTDDNITVPRKRGPRRDARAQ